MKRSRLCTIILVGVLLLGEAGWGWLPPMQAGAAPSAIQAPVLKWQHGGCFSSWCETGWYSSPAVADLDGDGAVEVIGSAYSVVVLNGETGALEWRAASGHARSESGASNVGRTWPGIVVADLQGDGDLEIVTAHSGGVVSVYNHVGEFEPGWPQNPTPRELRGLSVYDLDGDGHLEVIVTGAVYEKRNTWVFGADGVLRDGWPQLAGETPGYAYGVFNATATAGDLDGDGAGEVIVPSDVHYICAYEANGTPLAANAMYGQKTWGEVGVWESLETELRGWGTCNGARAERYRTNFAHGSSAIADLNQDGVLELVATGNVYDCAYGHPPGKYNGLYVFNADRSRFNQDGFDWNLPPVDTGAPLSEDYNVIESAPPNLALADLDNNGSLEIVYPSYDGRMHAFWLDKSEHGKWPYSVHDPGEGIYRFASEAAIADLDNDGTAEVIFTSWVSKGSGKTGKLHILDYLGNPLHEVDLPPAYGNVNWNGAMAAPTLANIDGDPELEVVINTAHSGFVAYDLPGTAMANILWGTGRGNFWRNASLNQGSLSASEKRMGGSMVQPGDVFTTTILLRNPGLLLSDVTVTDALPVELLFSGSLWASSGTASEEAGVVTWSGAVGPGQPVTISFEVTASQQVTDARFVVNTAVIEDGLGNQWRRHASVVFNGYAAYLPLMRRGGKP